ncbi:MAG: trigger factor [Desulfobacterales bacterium SG8_35]|nr:MAG: trigger factor [Desulfobacterales bacterium SG8_35]
MQVTINEVGGLTKKLKIVLPKEEVAKELDAGFRKIKNDARIKGFRRGKVPRHILERTYGQQVRAEVAEKLVQATYFNAVEKEKLDVVAHPEIKAPVFEEDGSFSYEAEVDTRPQFELHDYKGVEIEKEEIEVTEAEIDSEIAGLRKEMAPLRSVEDRAAQENDIVIVDFDGYHDGEQMQQVHGEKVNVDVGTGRHGEEFENKLIGMKKGEESSVEVDFTAESPNPLLAGKKVEFKIKVHDIKERVLPELDDEFAKDVGEEFDSLAALRRHISEKIRAEKEQALEGEIADRIMQKLLEGNQFEVPSRLVQYEINEYIKQTEDTLRRGGLSLEAAGINRSEAEERYRETAVKRVRGDFILKKIAEQEDIKVQDEDINKGFARIAKQYNMTVSEVKGYFKNRDDMLPFINELLNEKILKFLSDEAKYTPLAAAASGEEAQSSGTEAEAVEEITANNESSGE